MPKTNSPRPSLFIASSAEALKIAYAVQSNLAKVAEVTVWDQDVFRPSYFILESLISQLDRHDFAIFLIGLEDAAIIREREFKVGRDNVIFELGLFTGSLGLKRCYIIHPRIDEEFHLPSDLMGVNVLTYDPHRTDKNWKAELNPACDSISDLIKEKGKRLKEIGASKRTPDNVFLEKLIKAALETV